MYFTRHAERKLEVLERHGFPIARRDVLEAVAHPDLIDASRAPLLIAQRRLDATHVLRVVFKRENGYAKIITFYPGKRTQYEKN